MYLYLPDTTCLLITFSRALPIYNYRDWSNLSAGPALVFFGLHYRSIPPQTHRCSLSQLVSRSVCLFVTSFFFTFTIIHVAAAFQPNLPTCENKERRKAKNRMKMAERGDKKGNPDPNDPLRINWNITLHYIEII